MAKLIFASIVAILVIIFSADDTVSVSMKGKQYTYSYILKIHSKDKGRKPTSKTDLPMVIVLHGDDDSPSSFYKKTFKSFNNINSRVILIKGPFKKGLFNSRWPVNSYKTINNYGDAFAGIVDELTRKFPTVGKPLIFGFDGGGVMSYYQAAHHSNKYSYIIPVGATLPDEFYADEIDLITGEDDEDVTGVFAFHSEKDLVVNILKAKKTIRRLIELGLDVEFLPYAGGHEFGSDINLEVIEKIKQLVQEEII